MSAQSEQTPLIRPPSKGSQYEGRSTTQNLQGRKTTSKIANNSKLGLQRLSRTTQKLKLLPEDPPDLGYERIKLNPENYSENHSRDGGVYSQVTRITDKPARKDAEILGKSHRDLLPRVTAYCTAGSYKMKDLLRWLKDKKRIHNTMPKLFDECLYTPFTYKDWRNDSDDGGKTLIRLADDGGEIEFGKQNDIFIFEYGVVIMWCYTRKEEMAFLEDLARFESEKLSSEDVQVEEFNYYITTSYQPRIYNDFITLRDDANYMLKLSISHALAQSVKISLFEELVDNTIEDTQDIPQQIAHTGKVEMTRDEIMKSIGELFILRININLHGSVLDSPELMWAEPHLEPIYQATRGYLEINQRVELLEQRLEVISDLLQMLKEQLGHSQEENLEFVVIVLVCIEVLVKFIRQHIEIVNTPIQLDVGREVCEMQSSWCKEEQDEERRLVRLIVKRRSYATFAISAEPVAPYSYASDDNSLVISCIRWKEKNICVVTSVDIILVLEHLVGEHFSIEEKSRVRRNLQFLKPYTVTKSSPECRRLFSSLMSMENPRPRNIEKGLKVFEWSNLFVAVNRVLSKYSANPDCSETKKLAALAEKNCSKSSSYSKQSSSGSGAVIHSCTRSHPMTCGSKQSKLDCDLSALDNSENSTSSTDLSLKSKSQTASTSVGASLDEKSFSGGSSSVESGSGRIVDDGFGSEDSNGTRKSNSKRKSGTIPEHEIKDFEESKSTTPVEGNHSSNLKYLPVSKLSTANMKKHDLELAQMDPSERGNTKFTNIGAAAAAEEMSSNTESSESKRRRSSRKKRKSLKLPAITSALDRRFPLPNPKQIELYTQGSDTVHLDPRPYSSNDSSTPISTEESSAESLSR
ncbi:hypothetical protein ACQ2H7_003936 [Candidozyma auris]